MERAAFSVVLYFGGSEARLEFLVVYIECRAESLHRVRPTSPGLSTTATVSKRRPSHDCT